jgi:hypothetical protein
MKSGAVHHIEGSMNGPLGDYCSHGHMRGLGVLRSHGGRWQAVQDGEVHIDIAVIAAPTADYFGNADGSHGKSACGSLGFALVDSVYADRVIVVTDSLVPFPCIPWQIQGNNVDYVVEVDSIGDPSMIVSGTTQITRSPDRLRISELVARFLRDSGIMRDGFSFQAGAGGIALAFVDYLARTMKAANVKASLKVLLDTSSTARPSILTPSARSPAIHGMCRPAHSPRTTFTAKVTLPRWWMQLCWAQPRLTLTSTPTWSRTQTGACCTALAAGRTASSLDAPFSPCPRSAIAFP